MNKVSNLNSARATNTISLTEAFIRAQNNAERILPPSDAPPAQPPAKPIALDYPHISAQPEYAIEVEKLNRFVAQREKAIEKLEALKVQVSVACEPEERTEDGLISKAESLLAGDLPRDLQAEMHKAAKLIDALKHAVEAQHGVLRRVVRDLSQAAGRRYSQEHKERVKRLIAAVVEIHASNQAERDLHHDLIRLGYTEGALPGMALHRVEDPADPFGNVTHYWYKEAKKYVKSEAEIAAGVRKALMAATLG